MSGISTPALFGLMLVAGALPLGVGALLNTLFPSGAIARVVSVFLGLASLYPVGHVGYEGTARLYYSGYPGLIIIYWVGVAIAIIILVVLIGIYFEEASEKDKASRDR